MSSLKRCPSFYADDASDLGSAVSDFDPEVLCAAVEQLTADVAALTALIADLRVLVAALQTPIPK